MNKDQVSGQAKDAKGSIKQGAGKMMDDPELRAEGGADKVKGKIQKAAGDIKDALKH